MVAVVVITLMLLIISEIETDKDNQNKNEKKYLEVVDEIEKCRLDNNSLFCNMSYMIKIINSYKRIIKEDLLHKELAFNSMQGILFQIKCYKDTKQNEEVLENIKISVENVQNLFDKIIKDIEDENIKADNIIKNSVLEKQKQFIELTKSMVKNYK